MTLQAIFNRIFKEVVIGKPINNDGHEYPAPVYLVWKWTLWQERFAAIQSKLTYIIKTWWNQEYNGKTYTAKIDYSEVP